MESCQGICKVLIAVWKALSWMSTYIRCCVYASTYPRVHKTILLCKESFCCHIFFRATQQLLITHTWTVALWVLIVAMGVFEEDADPWGKIQEIFVLPQPSVFCCCSLDLLFTPGFSVRHIFSHWSFWSSGATALWFPPQAISLSSLDNFNTVVDTTCKLSEIPHVVPGAQAEL